MTEQDSKDKYIKCSRCKMKYLNSDENISKYFGYNRLNEIYKTCAKCRDNRKQYIKNNPEKVKQISHQYWIDHKNEITKKRQELQKEADKSSGSIKYCNRCYRNKPVDEFMCPNGKSYNACYACLRSRYG